MFLSLLALAIGVGAYPLARRLTRRLERLKIRVDELGAGDLSARVEVEGGDEASVVPAGASGARHHQGDTRCLSREGGGTCFEVTLRVG